MDLLYLIMESHTVAAALGFGFVLYRNWKNPDRATRRYALMLAILFLGIAASGMGHVAANVIERRVYPWYSNPVAQRVYWAGHEVLVVSSWCWFLYCCAGLGRAKK